MVQPPRSVSAGAPHARERAIERFKPTSGAVLGWAGIGFAALILGYVVARVHTITGLRVGLGMLLAIVVVWSTQLRSRAVAFPSHLLLRNAAHDVRVPWTAIDEVTVRQTLNVWVGERRFVCVGIGRSVRSIVKETRRKRGSGLLGPSRWREFAERAERAAPDQTAMHYETWVVTRIEELAEQARAEALRSGAASSGSPRRTLAWPELAATAVLGVALLVSFWL
jgi:hypothetical protein